MITIDHEIITDLRESVTDLPPLFPLTEETLLFYFLNGVIFLIVFRSLGMIFRLLLNKQHALVTSAYNSDTPQERKILILGDSTAVGTGASKPEETIAGRLAHDFPHSQIINLAQNGGLIRDLNAQVKMTEGQVFDLVIVSAGGNDVWHMTRKSTIGKNLETILPTLRAMSDSRVIFLLYNNIGSAPIFPGIIQFFLKPRCEKIQDLIRVICHKYQISTVDLFTDDDHNPFSARPHELFASDGIHPSSRGYELWYNRMWREMVQRGFRYK